MTGNLNPSYKQTVGHGHAAAKQARVHALPAPPLQRRRRCSLLHIHTRITSSKLSCLRPSQRFTHVCVLLLVQAVLGPSAAERSRAPFLEPLMSLIRCMQQQRRQQSRPWVSPGGLMPLPQTYGIRLRQFCIGHNNGPGHHQHPS